MAWGRTGQCARAGSLSAGPGRGGLARRAPAAHRRPRVVGRHRHRLAPGRGHPVVRMDGLSGRPGRDSSPVVAGVGGVGVGVAGDPDYRTGRRTARSRRRAPPAATCRGRVRLCREAIYRRCPDLRRRPRTRRNGCLQPRSGRVGRLRGSPASRSRTRSSPASCRGAAVRARRVVGAVDPPARPRPAAPADRAGPDPLPRDGCSPVAARDVAPRGSRFVSRPVVSSDRGGRRCRDAAARDGLPGDDDAGSPGGDRPGPGCGLTARGRWPGSRRFGWCRWSDHRLGRHRARPCGRGVDRSCGSGPGRTLRAAVPLGLRLAPAACRPGRRGRCPGSRGQHRGGRTAHCRWPAEGHGAQHACRCCRSGRGPPGQQTSRDDHRRGHHRLPAGGQRARRGGPRSQRRGASTQPVAGCCCQDRGQRQ